MKKQKIVLLIIVFLSLIGSATLFSFREKVSERPNIIFLLADDLRYNSLGCMGNPIVKTPNIDQLAKQGTLFKNAFVTSPVCNISRASIFSGQYSNRHGISDFNTDFSDSARANNYPEVLSRNGYFTGFIGKYGVGNEMPENDFDYWKGFKGQGVFFYKDANSNPIHSTDLMGNQAIEFLNTRDKSKPFCLQVSFKAPHVEDKNSLHNGYVYSPFYESYYNKDVIPPPPTGNDKYYMAFPELFRISPKGIPNEARVRWDQRFSTQDKYQESVKSYYRLITGIDDVVKRIVDELKKNGLSKNTIIILSSDNGYSLGDHGLEGKWFGHDVSLRVPTIIYDGRQLQNKKINENIALNIDIAPTILDYAKVKAPKGMQGESLKSLIDGKANQWRKEFYYNHLLETERLQVYLPKSEGLVSLQYKYVRYFNDSNPDNFFYEELFDNSTDPTEIKNLAKEQTKNKIKNEMANKMTRYREALK